MFQKFFTNTIESKFIQNLLFNSYIPIYDTVDLGDIVIKDKVYVYKHYIIKCTETGELSNNFTTLDHYEFGEKNKQYLKNYISKNNYYDEYTHRYLGDYLRCYRDIYGIDLMPFYNCFSYFHMKNGSNDIDIVVEPSVVENISEDALYPRDNLFPGNSLYPSDGIANYVITQQGRVYAETVNENQSTNTYLVPIRFNKTYTIALDSSTQIAIKGVLCDDNGLLEESNQLQDSGLVFSQTQFNNPFTYRVDTTDIKTFNRERFLYLAIKLNKSNNSSIVVLEGDYTGNKTLYENGNFVPVESAVNYEYSITDKQWNNILLSDLSLLQMNDNNIYAFSDRLFEYLLENTITSQEFLPGNIKRTQDNLNNVIKLFSNNSSAEYDEKAYYGIWDNKIRQNIYKYFMNKDTKNSNWDINGFVDKDTENFLISNSFKYEQKQG